MHPRQGLQGFLRQGVGLAVLLRVAFFTRGDDKGEVSILPTGPLQPTQPIETAAEQFSMAQQLQSEEWLLDGTALSGQQHVPASSPRRTVSGPAESKSVPVESGNGHAVETTETKPSPKRKGSKRGSLTIQQFVGGLERFPSKLGLASSPQRQDSMKGAGAIGLLAMNKIRTKGKAKQARTVLQGLPMWLSKEVLARTTKRVKACKPSQQLAVLRVQNSVMQAEQPIWQKLVQIAMEDQDCEIAKEEVLQIVRKTQLELEQREQCHPDTAFFVPGPVGDTVLHACFLLGMVELGRQLVEETYNTPELVSLPYTNDLKVWFDAKVVGDELNDGGLYTGQTVLHIAIVRKDTELVQFLLGYQANIVARATGAFFQPKRCVTVLEHPTRYQRLVAWIRGMDLSREPLVEIRDVSDSGCYYGEYPLSFAVSVGSVELCTVLFDECQARKQAKDPCLKELFDNMSARHTAEGDLLSKFREVSDPSPQPVDASAVETAAIKAKRGSALSDSNVQPQVQRTAPSALQPPPDQPSPAPMSLLGPSSARRRFVEEGDASDEEGDGRALHQTFLPTRSVPTPPPPDSVEAARAQNRRSSFNQAAVHPVYSSILPFDLFINVQDSFGNTALHMAVLHRRPATMRWLIKNGADRSVSILNDEAFTPLTLAARLGYVTELEVLLAHSRVVAWTFGDVQMVRTPLEQVDTFRMKGSALHARPNWRSVIEVVVAHEVEAMCDHPLFDTLIKDKWTKFARRAHLVKGILPFFAGVLTTSLYLYARCFHRFHQLRAWLAGSGEAPRTQPLLDTDLWSDTGEDLYGRMSAVLSIACLLFIVVPSFLQGWKLRRLKQQDLDPNGDGDVSIYEVMLFVYKNLPFMLTWGLAVALLIGIIAAVIGNSRVELQAISVSAVLHWSMLLLHMSSFQSIGVLVIIIFKMLIGDIFKFLVVYVILVLAFSQALFALTQMSELPHAMDTLDVHPGRAFFALVWVSLGGRPLGMDKWSLIKHTANPSLTLVVYIVYVVLCTILMLNLLIAMMQKTFRADMRDTYKTWIFPFAQLVLRYESQLSPAQRLSKRSGYPAGLHVVHDVESEQYFETAVVPSIKSKREQQYAQERVRMEVVMQVLTDYLDVALRSLKYALRTLAEEVTVLKGKRSPMQNQRKQLWDSELFEDDDSPMNSPTQGRRQALKDSDEDEAAPDCPLLGGVKTDSKQSRASAASSDDLEKKGTDARENASATEGCNEAKSSNGGNSRMDPSNGESGVDEGSALQVDASGMAVNTEAAATEAMAENGRANKENQEGEENRAEAEADGKGQGTAGTEGRVVVEREPEALASTPPAVNDAVPSSQTESVPSDAKPKPAPVTAVPLQPESLVGAKPARQLTLKKLPTPTTPAMLRANTDAPLKRLPSSDGSKAPNTNARALTLKKLPTQTDKQASPTAASQSTLRLPHLRQLPRPSSGGSTRKEDAAPLSAREEVIAESAEEGAEAALREQLRLAAPAVHAPPAKDGGPPTPFNTLKAGVGAANSIQD